MSISELQLPVSRKIDDQKTGFLDLPVETRNLIYYLTLNPNTDHVIRGLDDSSYLGCTKILSLCKQTYLEARPYMRAYTPCYELGLGHRSLIRHPKANGKPALYASGTATSDCYRHQRCSEIELIRCSRIQLTCKQPHNIGVLTKAIRDVEEIQTVLLKTTNMETLKLRLAMWACTRVNETGLFEALADLLRACKQKDIAVLIEYAQPLDSDEFQTDMNTRPLAFYLHEVAAMHELEITFIPLDDAASSYLNEETAPHQVILRQSKDAGIANSRKNYNYYANDAELYQEHLFYHPADHEYKLQDYVTVPECRKCLRAFASRAELQQHLTDNPKHVMRFAKKRWNPITYYGAVRGGRVCWTCAYSCVAMDTLATHERKRKHTRHGIIPRYAEDNKEWDKYWKWHKKKFGWL